MTTKKVKIFCSSEFSLIDRNDVAVMITFRYKMPSIQIIAKSLKSKESITEYINIDGTDDEIVSVSTLWKERFGAATARRGITSEYRNSEWDTIVTLFEHQAPLDYNFEGVSSFLARKAEYWKE